MKNTRAIWMLVISVMLGIGVMILAANQVTTQAISSSKVVVAAADIEAGAKLTPQMLSVVDWPIGSVPLGTFSNEKGLSDRVIKTTTQRGEAILESKLAPIGSAGGLSAVISDGKRAMTVRVNDVVGVAGFALPGNYVDILVNAQVETGKANETKPVSKTVLEHVLVLAVAQEAGRDDTKPKVVNAVTLELSPAEAEKIDLARNVGILSLVLRNQVDASAIATAGATKSQLFGEEKSEPNAPPLFAKPAASKPARPKLIAEAVRTKQDCVEVIQDGARALNCF